jgi:hypothetical protein
MSSTIKKKRFSGPEIQTTKSQYFSLEYFVEIKDKSPTIQQWLIEDFFNDTHFKNEVPREEEVEETKIN